ncbi:ABC transporter permease [Micromonospora deserti]|uniref:Transporter n=1 Tax=Micromonospora deserti TaxID=2070366 RepID=A0A2W2ED26_9ACTN|nr:transporter [Micromonospora deserti]PZG02724.1 transporter [Micromonospora deserti]
MIWLTWRQHRREALFALAGLAVIGTLMVVTGLAMRTAFNDYGLPECVARAGDAGAGSNCNRAFNQFYDQFSAVSLAGILFLVLPLLVGLFWGAPLVAREVEQGTHRFVWTQGVSRRRWALVKFGLVGAAALVASVGYGLGVSWWVSPLNQGWRQNRFDAFFFDMQGVAPVGYTLFAVALGIFAGTVWPRMLPAMAATLVGFVGVRVALATLARPRYLPARELTYPVQGTGEPDPTGGDWILSSGVHDASGRMVAPNAQVICPPGASGPDGRACGAELGLGPGAYNWQLYQPGSRYWLFQTIETGIFVALAVLLLVLAIRRIRRIA